MDLPSRFSAWNEALELGIPSIDADHRGFLELMNDLYAAMERGDGGGRTRATLDALRAYATYHFIREEDVMGAAGYPGLQAQQMEHAWYLYYLEKLEGLSYTDPASALETTSFMRTWFLDHILGADRRFSQWLAAMDGGASAGAPPPPPASRLHGGDEGCRQAAGLAAGASPVELRPEGGDLRQDAPLLLGPVAQGLGGGPVDRLHRVERVAESRDRVPASSPGRPARRPGGGELLEPLQRDRVA